jgi:hypothetical protein
METTATCSRMRRERRPCRAQIHCHALTMLPPPSPSWAPPGRRVAVDWTAACT